MAADFDRELYRMQQWIAEREVVAGSHTLGLDYAHATLLWERFSEFARYTNSVGSTRVAAVNAIADALVAADLTKATAVTHRKEALNKAWANLRELIDTRMRILDASRELHKYFSDWKDLLERIETSRNANLGQYQVRLETRVRAIQAESARLQSAYTGNKALEVESCEREVVRAWHELQAATAESRRARPNDYAKIRSICCCLLQ